MAATKKKTKKRTTKKNCRAKKALKNDWYKDLREEEKGLNDGKEFVLFAGLCRLAEDAGKVSEEITHKNVEVLSFESRNSYNIIVSISAKVTFSDDTVWIGSADAHLGNCCDGFKQYPTALAETRALARAYRRALGIYVVSSEEMSDVDEGVMTGQADPQQLALIRKHCKTLSIDQIKVVESVCTREGISAIDKLTYEEAHAACEQLNKLVAENHKAKKKAAKKND